MYNIKSLGRYATRKQYALETLWLGTKAVGWVNWLRIFFVVVWFLMYMIFTQPVAINYVAAEEVATSTPVEEPKEVMIEVRINWTKERIDQEIEKKAAEYGKSAARLKAIVKCESGYVTDVQSRHMLSYGREKSFGLAQIHLPDHPKVSYKQAIDPAFAIDFLAKNVDRVTWYCDK